ncbi:unnamed protein product [Peronospora destructor]|uniref:DEK-C domain-containing protein n=1 Tax=Peronospora destructor TaxID=86335 RepID=A0AAV0T726_9STRA|nr:unnamed protein product [Peronospora destructor]
MMDGQQKPEMTLIVDTQTETIPEPDDKVQALASVSDTVFTTSLGGRVRKTTQMFTFTQAKSDEADAFLPPVGKGIKVRNMQFVRNNVEALGKKQQEMIKQLYSIMFGRRFQQKNVKVIKEHILDFSGVIEQDEKSREHLIDKMGKWKLIFVHEVMDFLAVDRSKKSFDEEGKLLNKEVLLERLADWLYNPQETKLGGKKAVIAAKKAKQKANKRAKATKKSEIEPAKKSEIEPAKKKRRITKKKDVAVKEDEGENDHEATKSELSSDFEESKKTIVQKRKVARRSKKSHIVERGNDNNESENETNSFAEKDELQPAPDLQNEANLFDKEEAKTKTEVLDADVCNKIRDIITHGNAEELTEKKIVQQLSADLGRDVTAQKNDELYVSSFKFSLFSSHIMIG